jgi:tRNA (Thr-GGU) A37 N-methylase
MNGIETFPVRAIGVVRSTLRAPGEAPNQAFEGAPEAVLEIHPGFRDALHRIGVHRVTITALEGPTTLRVGALEAIDGTPIVDLKIAMPATSEN